MKIRSKIKKGLVVILAIVVVCALVGQVTPVPGAMIVRMMVREPVGTRPDNYKEIEVLVAEQNDVRYPSAGEENLLDIYYPKDLAGQKFPAIIWVHGGFFVGGDKEYAEVFGKTLASYGYVVVAMNYERAPEAIYPAPLLQIGEVYQFVVGDLAKEYPINSAQVFFAGDSAGAQMVAQFAAVQSNEAYSAILNVPRTVPLENLKGVLLYCGPYSIQRLGDGSKGFLIQQVFNQCGWAYLGERDWEMAASQKGADIFPYINSNYPPAFITDGNQVSFADQGEMLAERIKSQGGRVEVLFFPDKKVITPHEYQFFLGSEPGQEALRRTLQFLDSSFK